MTATSRKTQPPVDSSQKDSASPDSKQKEPASPDDKARWSSPPTVMALAALIISVGGNLIQYIKAGNDLDIAKSQLRLQSEKWETERKKLEADLVPLRRREELTKGIVDELDQIKNDLAVWDKAIFDSEMQLAKMKAALNTALNQPDAADHKFTIQAQKDNIAITEDALKLRKQNGDELITRRREIEGLLR